MRLCTTRRDRASLHQTMSLNMAKKKHTHTHTHISSTYTEAVLETAWDSESLAKTTTTRTPKLHRAPTSSLLLRYCSPLGGTLSLARKVHNLEGTAQR